MLGKLPVLFGCVLYLASFFLPAWVHDGGKTDLGYEVFVLSFNLQSFCTSGSAVVLCVVAYALLITLLLTRERLKGW